MKYNLNEKHAQYNDNRKFLIQNRVYLTEKSKTKIYKKYDKTRFKKIHTIYIIARFRNQVLSSKNRNYKFVVFTFYWLTSSYCKVKDGVVRYWFKLIFRKPRLKLIRLGLVTKLEGRLFHGWTTLQEKKCFLMLVFATGTMNRNWWPRVLVLGENVKKVWGWRQMLLWTIL